MSAPTTPLRGPRHVRRVRAPSSGISRRGLGLRTYVLLAIGAAGLVVGAGYAIGAFVIGTFASTPAQSSAAGSPEGPPGVSYSVAEAEVVATNTTPAGGSCLATNLGTMASPTALSNGNATAICLTYNNTSGFATGTTMYVLGVVWNHTALNSTIFKVQIGLQVLPSTHNLAVTSYVKTSAAITVNETAYFAVDLTEASDTGVTGYQVLVTEV